MREYKFRGQRTDNKEWVIGDLLQNYIHHNSGTTIQQGGCVFYEVEKETVGQYTGKTTKSNQEIFENDILQSSSGGLWIVKWSELNDGWKCYQWKYEDFTGEKIWSIDDDRYPLGHSLSGLLTYDYKVIGTIYDYKTES